MNLLLCLLLPALYAASEKDFSRPLPQAIVEKADGILALPEGKVTGRLKHVYIGGKSFAFDVQVITSGENSLALFHSKRRGEEIKILSRLKGADVHVFFMQQEARHIHKTPGSDKYQPALKTNYSYADFSGYSLRNNYHARAAGEEAVKGRECYKTELIALEPAFGYSNLMLYSEKETLMPLRIEYRLKPGIIIKVLEIARVMEKGGDVFPVRYEMSDVRSGSVSFLVFYKPNLTYKADPSLFNPSEHER